MKWGVQRRENRAASLQRVADGKGTFGDKTKAVATLSRSGVSRNGGLRGAAGNKAANIRAVEARIQRGEGTVMDIIKRNGGDLLIDTGRKDRGRR